MRRFHVRGRNGFVPRFTVPGSYFLRSVTTTPSALLPAFTAVIEIIGVNPYVLLPEAILTKLFAQADKNKGPIPVRCTVDGHSFIQTLVKFAGAWRLYINGPMLKATQKGVGDTINVRIAFDPADRSIPMHPVLGDALKAEPVAMKVFESLPPSRKKEIVRYIGHLKSDGAVKRNVTRAIAFLQGKERFIGRDGP